MLTEVKFRLAGGAQPLILVPVQVNDEGAYDFILDTGAGTCLLTPELARCHGFEATSSKEGQFAGGRAHVPTGNIASLAIGAARLEHVEVAVIALDDLSRAVGAEIDGNIGFSYLRNFRLTIDYQQHTLRLARGQHETIGQAVLNEIPFRLAAPTKPLVLVRALANGHGPHEFALDTGASMTILAPELAHTLNIKGQPIPPISTGGGHKAAASIAPLQSLAIGAAQVQNFQVLIADIFTALNQATGAHLDGIIGYNFLKQFTVTIDYPNQTLLLEK